MGNNFVNVVDAIVKHNGRSFFYRIVDPAEIGVRARVYLCVDTYVIEYDPSLTESEKCEAISHEKGHVYLREWGYDCTESINTFCEEIGANPETLGNQLANFFDHWLIVDLLDKYSVSNNFFLRELREGVIKSCVDIGSQASLNENLHVVLGLLDLHNCDRAFQVSQISKSPIIEILFNNLQEMVNILTFDNNMDVDSKEFMEAYLQRIEIFLESLKIYILQIF